MYNSDKKYDKKYPSDRITFESKTRTQKRFRSKKIGDSVIADAQKEIGLATSI